ncbi:MAG: TMEM175 family protein [Balneola sp.]
MHSTSIISKNRLEAFSDGVFAIIITLLVLEIKVPELDSTVTSAGLMKVLIHEVPSFLSWVISFLIVAVFWVNHHRFFEELRQTDNKLVWMNMFLVLCVSFIPFPSGLVGNYPGNTTAILLFGIVMISASLIFSGMRYYVLKIPELHREECKEVTLRHRARLSLIMGPGLWCVATLSSLIHPYLALVFFALIPIYFIIPKI